MAEPAELLKALRIERAQRELRTSTPPRWPWWLGGLLLLVLIGAGVAWWLLPRAVPVDTAVAAAPNVTAGGGAVLEATGYITARRQATVSAQITGTLTEVLIEEGDRVEKGQVLARLEDNAYRANLNASRASALAAEAQLGQLQAQIDQAERDARRQEQLATRGLTPRQSAEQARTQVVTLQAQLKAQRRQVQAAQAQTAVAQVNYDYTVVRAPFTGVITDKAAQIGEIISPLSAGGGFTRTGVGTIVDMDSLEIEVDVNEAYIGRVRAQMPAQAQLDAYTDWKIPAHVIAIVPAADRGKATVKVRVALEQKDPRIVPDMGVRVAFLEQRAAPSDTPPAGVLVPAAALAQREGRTVVFVLAGDTVQQRAVQPATPDSGQFKRIPAGIKPGETVVLAPPPQLRDGMAVKRRRAESG
jgi:RND family efflux transporter MFP subunit